MVGLRVGDAVGNKVGLDEETKDGATLGFALGREVGMYDEI